MPPKGYRSVSIPSALLDEADDLLKELQANGHKPLYSNITDFVKDSVRQRILELRKLYLLGEPEK